MPPEDVPEPARFPLDAVKRTIWLTRPDLRRLGGGAGFEWWLLLNGVHEYRGLAEAGLRVSRELLSEPADDALPGVRPVLTRFMRAIWASRSDLQEAFDVTAAQGQEGFVWWYFIHGVAELGLARFLTGEQKAFLNEPDPGFPQNTLPLTRFMVRLWQRRPDLQRAFPLDAPAGCAGFVEWFRTTARSEPKLGETCRELQEPARPAFHERPAGEEGHARIPALRCQADAAAPRTAMAAAPRTAMAPAVRARSAALPFGVNLIGHARGQFGIGEDVRMAALAMQAAGIPFSVYNVAPGREVCQDDDSVDSLVSDRLPYAVNLICTTGFETARLAAVEGSALFDGRRTIGYWPWELPEWPAEWHHAYAFVDEVWAASRYTYEAFARSSPKPVRHMPMAVAVGATAGLGRRDFGLPGQRFLFVFSFDVLSLFSRKNPQACVRAFRSAFPSGDEPVGLVIKAMRPSPDDPVWQALLQEAGADRRIAIIGRTLSRGAVLDLYRACDAFVSLHRAEGFGRGIAEAMMLGKPVIVTGFSGNMDFTTPGSAALVDHRLRKVAEGEYPFAGGLTWAEPDAAHAAWWMRRLVEDRQVRERLGKQGQGLVAGTYAPATVGSGYAALLGRAPFGPSPPPAGGIAPAATASISSR